MESPAAPPQPASPSRSGWLAAPPSLPLLLALALLLGFGFLGSRGLYEPDEGRYVGAALEMLESGNFLVPTLDNVPHLTKPPLTYWLVAAGVMLAGENEWGARLFLGLAFVAHVTLVIAIGTMLGGARVGRWSGLVYATMLMTFVGTSVVTADALVALWQAAAVACFVRAWRAIEPRTAHRWLMVMWAAFGLAFLTKGPPGLLALLALALFVAMSRKREPRAARIARLAGHPGGIVVFATLGLGWFAIIGASEPSFSGALMRNEVVSRMFTAVHERNPEWYRPFTLYLPAVLLGALPWSLGWPGQIARHLFGRRTSAPSHQEDAEAVANRRARRLLWVWLLVPLGVLCLSRSRLPLYLLPSFTPLALLIAHGRAPPGGWRGAPDRPSRRAKRWLAGVAIWVVVLLTLRVAASHLPSDRDARRIAELIRPHFNPATDELVIVGRSFYGLALYLDGPMEAARTVSADESELVQRSSIEDELAELRWTRYRHLFIAREIDLPRLQRGLDRFGAACRLGSHESSLVLIVCEPAPSDGGADHLRLAVMIDRRSAGLDRFRQIHEIRELDKYLELDGAVIWRRPSRSWRGRLASILAPVPGVLRPLVSRDVSVLVIDDDSVGSGSSARTLTPGRAELNIHDGPADGLYLVSRGDARSSGAADRPIVALWTVEAGGGTSAANALDSAFSRAARENASFLEVTHLVAIAARAPDADGKPPSYVDAAIYKVSDESSGRLDRLESSRSDRDILIFEVDQTGPRSTARFTQLP